MTAYLLTHSTLPTIVIAPLANGTAAMGMGGRVSIVDIEAARRQWRKWPGVKSQTVADFVLHGRASYDDSRLMTLTAAGVTYRAWRD